MAKRKWEIVWLVALIGTALSAAFLLQVSLEDGLIRDIRRVHGKPVE